MKDLTRRSALASAGVVAAAVCATATQAAQDPAQSDLSKEKLRLRAATAVKTWHTVNRPTAQSAADFVNLSPAQGGGEVSISVKSDGTYDVFYLL
jgi:hypothetical protein